MLTGALIPKARQGPVSHRLLLVAEGTQLCATNMFGVSFTISFMTDLANTIFYDYAQIHMTTKGAGITIFFFSLVIVSVTAL